MAVYVELKIIDIYGYFKASSDVFQKIPRLVLLLWVA